MAQNLTRATGQANENLGVGSASNYHKKNCCKLQRRKTDGTKQGRHIQCGSEISGLIMSLEWAFCHSIVGEMPQAVPELWRDWGGGYLFYHSASRVDACACAPTGRLIIFAIFGQR